jgi:hypothetical protein
LSFLTNPIVKKSKADAKDKYFIRQSGDRNWIFISHIWNLIAHGECGDF